MKNRDLFHKDPLSWHLANEGVSSNNDADLATLRYELETFVCDGEYKTGLVKMLQGYLGNLDKVQAGSWVSGFYGSGKSHLVKVLRYLWTDFAFPDSSTARSLTSLPQDVTDLLKELSTKGKQGGGLHAAGGTLKSGKGDVRARVLGIIFLSVGYPEELSVARLMLDLRDDGTLDAVRQHIQDAGKDPKAEFSKIYTSKAFQEAYLASHGNLGDTKGVAAAMLAQYPPKGGELSVDEMITLMRRTLSKDGKLQAGWRHGGLRAKPDAAAQLDLLLFDGLPDFTLAFAHAKRGTELFGGHVIAGFREMRIGFAAALVPAGRLHAKDGDRHLAGFRRDDEIGPERAVLTSSFDDVSCLDKEVGISGILDQEFVHIPGLVKESGLVFHRLLEDGVVGNLLPRRNGDKPGGEIFCGGGRSESFHNAGQNLTATRSTSVLP